VKTENPSVCVTVKCKLCKSAITLYSLYLSVIKRDYNQSANKANHPNYNPSLCHAYHPTRDTIYDLFNDADSSLEYVVWP
jgi:hypothetical protein